MPQKDVTRPEGKGPKTGRGMGPCSIGKPNVEPEEVFFWASGLGKGLGRGRRRFLKD